VVGKVGREGKPRDFSQPALTRSIQLGRSSSPTAKDLFKQKQFDDSFYIYDGQTRDLLASYTMRGSDPKGYPYLGFGCGDWQCVQQRIQEYMKGQDCDPLCPPHGSVRGGSSASFLSSSEAEGGGLAQCGVGCRARCTFVPLSLFDDRGEEVGLT
jgi:hypothetical protein